MTVAETGHRVAADSYDLLVISIPGVQRFIDEVRSTADAHAASEIVMRLAKVGAGACVAAVPGVVSVFPAGILRETAVRDGGPGLAEGPDGAGTSMEIANAPNRIVVQVPSGAGDVVARAAVEAVVAEWKRMLRRVFGLSESAAVPSTPGMPVVVWVRVPGGGKDGYAGQWAQAQAGMAARRRLRDFPLVAVDDAELCDLSPRWAAASSDARPPGLRGHEEARLAPANWVKRRWAQVDGVVGFPSTSSIASAPFRREVLNRLADEETAERVRALSVAAQRVSRVLETPVPGLISPDTEPGRWLVRSGGAWVYPEHWEPERLARDTDRDMGEIGPLAERGRAAAQALGEHMAERHGVREPTDYLAVIVQDLDGMGLFLSGHHGAADGSRLGVDPAEHRRISGRLGELAIRQAALLREPRHLGVSVYAGGDDLLGFLPAGTALDAARECRDAVTTDLPTASTAVVFFHRTHGLRDALASARDLLNKAKEQVRGKNALAVCYLRRSGVREETIRPWHDPFGLNCEERMRVFAADAGHPLSPRLLTDLERDEEALAAVHRQNKAHHLAELSRLVHRHMGGAEGSPDAAAAKKAAAKDVAEQLVALGQDEVLLPKAARGDGSHPVRAARVAVFLRNEGWSYDQAQAIEPEEAP